MVERQAGLLAYFKQITPGLQGGPLETLGTIDLATALTPKAQVPGQYRQLVERTISKLVDHRPLSDRESWAFEAIIIPDKRPAIDILERNSFTTDHPDWQHLLAAPALTAISGAIAAVGRIELPGHPTLPYGGTGFAVARNLVMTNRHVADIFATGLGVHELDFRPGVAAGVDLERRRDGGSVPLTVRKVLMIHPFWDMALIEVDGLPEVIKPLQLAVAGPQNTPDIVAIGYPAFDPRNNADVQNQVFGGIYNVKRLMPGRLTGSMATVGYGGNTVTASTHDSSTLGGASGSAVADIVSGEVLALHFGGVYGKTNYGVPAHQLARDGRVIDAGVEFAGDPQRQDTEWDHLWNDTEASRPVPKPRLSAGTAQVKPAAQPGRLSVTIPLHVTVEVGAPLARTSVQAPAPERTGGDDEVVPIEAPADDYRDRTGYVADFLGPAVALPQVVGAAADVLQFGPSGAPETVLRYEHFSVVMSRSRRMCFFSAVNIDGTQSRKSGRVGWRRDPRIPAKQQILNECYGNPPGKFSRGHMTRREDPVWGPPETAERGNADSMHVTNTCPQMQAFNSPIWLALEDYALEHARSDGMKITVFTGPYFSSNDPVYFGVRVPVRFWKVIAFIHDRTGKLCATGYEMGQEQSLPPSQEEFVFGQFRSPQLGITTQTALTTIEARAGLSFGDLVGFDPLSRGHEAISAETDTLLEILEQVRFVD